MRARVASVAVLAGPVGTVASYTAAASGRQETAPCAAVHVSGGNFNGLTGGTIVAAVKVRNLGKRACTLNGRPWIRLGPLHHAVTVEDATPPFFGSNNSTIPKPLQTLRPGRHATAQIFIAPGSCGLARWQVFELRARAGWAERGIPIRNLVCKNGTGQIWVDSFRRW